LLAAALRAVTEKRKENKTRLKYQALSPLFSTVDLTPIGVALRGVREPNCLRTFRKKLEFVKFDHFS
jgi:hypothetical protein